MSNLKFRVVLDIETEVFRDIVIQKTSTFLHLYNAIIDAFEFSGEELASFYISNDNWDKGREIALMDMGSEPGTPIEEQTLEMARTKLEQFAVKKNDKFILVYDFMNMWCFFVDLVETDLKHTGELPAVIYSFGDAPSEKSRGDNYGDDEDSMSGKSLRSGDDEFDFDDDEIGDEFGFDEFEPGVDESDF
jgi:hypothetical protein